jgi:hypothetical protein
MSEENKALARKAIRIWTTGDFDAANEIYSPDHVNHQHHRPSEDTQDLHGVEAHEWFVGNWRSCKPLEFSFSFLKTCRFAERCPPCFDPLRNPLDHLP